MSNSNDNNATTTIRFRITLPSIELCGEPKPDMPMPLVDKIVVGTAVSLILLFGIGGLVAALASAMTA